MKLATTLIAAEYLSIEKAMEKTQEATTLKYDLGDRDAVDRLDAHYDQLEEKLDGLFKAIMAVEEVEHEKALEFINQYALDQ